MNDVRKSIGWADYTWNPITGCSPISEGCQNCYARAMAKRLAANPNVPNRERYEGFKPVFWPERLVEPGEFKNPLIIFVCSMGDLFHEAVPDEWVVSVFDSMATDILQPCLHTYMILTKRPDRMRDFFRRHTTDRGPIKWPNVWLGVTTENQEQADKRIPALLSIPAAHYFVSVEPMLGPVDLTWDVGTGEGHRDSFLNHGLDLVICGPETGPKARPCDPAWIEDLARQSPRFYDKRKENPIARWRPGDQVIGHRLMVAR